MIKITNLHVDTVPPALRGSKLVWQIGYNEDSISGRKYVYEETKVKAIKTAKEKLKKDKRKYPDVYVCWYPDTPDRTIRIDGKIVGYVNGG